MRARLLLFLLFLLSAVSAFIIPLVRFKDACITRDWGLFNSFSLFSNSSWNVYHKIPIHNPYVLGGMDNLANPQTKVFSPLAFFDVFLSPPYANLFSLLTLSVIGAYGIYFLLKYLKVSKSVAVICAIIFVHASWFHLHFSEGHVIFGGFLLFGAVIHSILRFEENRFKLLFAIVCAFFLLDGGIYAFIYSVLIFVSMHLLQVNGLSFRKLFVNLKENVLFSIASLFVFIGLSSFKLIPLLMAHGDRHPVLENRTLDVYSVFNAFFNPNAHVSLLVPGANFKQYLNFHEVGTYIGFVALSVILFFLFRYRSRKNWSYLFMVALFFWIGSGWLDPVNPWRLFQQIPIINNAHIQSRAFIVVYCFLIILLAFGLDKLKELKSLVFKGISLFLLLEALFLSNWAYFKIYENPDNTVKTFAIPQVINFSKVDKTYPNPASYGWGFDFEHYNRWNACTKTFMDPTSKPIQVKSYDEIGYKGEIYLLNGNGKVEVQSFIPGEIMINYRLEVTSDVQVNTNYLLGWKSSNPRIKVKNQKDLLTLQIPKGNGTVKVFYQPKYFLICMILSGLALLLSLLLCWKSLRI